MSQGLAHWAAASNTFAYVELSSLVLLLACVADWHSTPWYKYALAVACVSLFACLVLQTAEFLIPGVLDTPVIKQREDGTGGHSLQKMCSVALLVWWVFGAVIITFHAPFVDTSNGWFAAWGGLFATVKWCTGTKAFYSEKPEGLKQLYHIAICSVVLLAASIRPLLQKWEHFGGAVFAIIGAAITIITCAYMASLYSEVSRNLMTVTAAILFALWTLVAGVCTFYGPFLVTNNGFFAAWLGCLCSLNLMVIQMKDGAPGNFV